MGIFLRRCNVHVTRAPGSGRVRALCYRRGEFLDARHPEAGRRNESNTVLIDPDAPMPGPVEVRQIAGLVARRIICHARANTFLAIGERFGLIKFGSRTELIIPLSDGTDIQVKVGDKVRAGVTIIARQRPATTEAPSGATPASAAVSGIVDCGLEIVNRHSTILHLEIRTVFHGICQPDPPAPRAAAAGDSSRCSFSRPG